MKYVGIKNGKIKMISDTVFRNDDLDIVMLPNELNGISNQSIIVDYGFRSGMFRLKAENRPASELKVAFVSNWLMRCGIATYAESLYPEIIKQVKDYRIFAERNDTPTPDTTGVPTDKIIPCWKRGEPMSELASAINGYDPDIVLINHEPGLFGHAGYWLSLLTQLSDYRVITTMHSVYLNHKDKIIFEAAMPEIIVHLQGAKDNLLKDKGINGKVHMIPHGCYPIKDQRKLWNNYRSEHTFIQQGFGFAYKGFSSSIRAASILKAKYQDVFFTALFSESPHNKYGHQAYYDELRDLIDELELENNVAIIRGFQPDNVLDAYLRSNQASVFPYQSTPGHEVFGASGAIRLAMAAGIPVISSSIPHFHDVPSIKADNPEKIAEELDTLFSSEDNRRKQIAKQNAFIEETGWDKVAKMYIDVIES